MGENCRGDVPFSWEQKPGVSKVTPEFHCQNHHHHPKLPPPPRGAAPAPESYRGRHSVLCQRDLQIPLPPCTFQPSMRSSSQKGLNSSQKGVNSSQKRVMRKQDDPFLIAYKECTKSVRSEGNNKFMWFSKDDGLDFGIKKKKKKNSNIFFSCKNTCSVAEDKIVRVSQLPLSKSHREQVVCMKRSP